MRFFSFRSIFLILVLLIFLIILIFFYSNEFGEFSLSSLKFSKIGKEWWFGTFYDKNKSLGGRIMFLFPKAQSCLLDVVIFNENFTRFMELYNKEDCYISEDRTRVKMGENFFEKIDDDWHFLVNLSEIFIDIHMNGKNGFFISKEGTRVIVPIVNSIAKGEIKMKSNATFINGISYLEFITTPEINPQWIWGYFEDGKISIMVVNAKSGAKREIWVVVYDGNYHYYNKGEVSLVNNTLRVKVSNINLLGTPLNDFIMEIKGKIYGKEFKGIGFYEITYK